MSRTTAVLCILVLLLAAPVASAVVAVPVEHGQRLTPDASAGTFVVPEAPSIACSSTVTDIHTLRGPPRDLLQA